MGGDRAYARFSMMLGQAGLKAVGRLNAPLYRATGGRLFARYAGNPILLLTTTGRRSGEPRIAPLLYMRDGDRLVVIGSNAGNRSAPAWALNLEADPLGQVQVGRRRHNVRARVAEGEERTDLWRRMNDSYGGFEHYAARTSRDISVFVLEPVA